MATASRAAKLRRLEDLRRRVPYASQSALAAVLEEVERAGVPELHQRHHMREATRQALDACQRYGPLLCEREVAVKTGGCTKLQFVNLLSLLAGAFEQGGSFQELMQDTMRRARSTLEQPWRLILYLDEVVPGNVLAHRLERKVWVAYASFLEFGVHLTQEPAWLVVGAFRSTTVQKVSAGISQIAAEILRSIFCGPVRPQAGVLMPGEPPMRVYFKFALWLQDGAARKHVYCIKGDAGSRFCLLCKNAMCFRSAQDITDEDDDQFAGVCDLLRHADLRLCSDSDVLASADRMAERVRRGISKADLQKWEQASGITTTIRTRF